MVLVGRLAQLQLVEHDRYVEQARAEHWGQAESRALRGAILDRNGYPLALTTAVYNVYLEPKATPTQRADAARRLAPALETTPQAIAAAWAGIGEQPLPLARNVTYDRGTLIAGLNLAGVSLVREPKRLYPQGSMAAPLLGFVGKEERGLTGIEAAFDREIGGVPGVLFYERDSLGQPIPAGYSELTPPQPGGDITLTIDRFIQRLIERELDKAVLTHTASGGTIIVMDPSTGEILGMASRPTFDLAQLDLRKPPPMNLFKNRAVTDLYEPGSVFKPVTMAAALNEKLITPDTAFNDGGPLVRYGWTIDTWDGRHHGRETMTQVLQNSCNIGAAWVSDLLGPERFYRYVANFGFGQPTLVGLAGEAAGQVRTPKDDGWWPIDLNTNSFGQGISVTPLQMATAYSAIANGGLLMRPTVIKEMIDDGKRRVTQPVVVRRVIAEESARLLRTMLNAAAEQGESKLAIVPGYHIGGKTGTASIPGANGYEKGKTIASFIGFVPYDAPKYVILVKIDEPKDNPYGSVVASPVFASLAKELMIYGRIPPTDPQALVKAAPKG